MALKLSVPIPHGTQGGYTNHKCRCDECRAAWAAFCRRAKERRAASVPDELHGTEFGYSNYKCRCPNCTQAWSAAVADRKRRAKLGQTDVGGEKRAKVLRGRAKLDPQKVRKIRESDETNVALARRYGVSPSAIKLVRNGATWGNVG
jgi:hypothetical protein